MGVRSKTYRKSGKWKWFRGNPPAVSDIYKKDKLYRLKFLDSPPDLWNSSMAKNEKKIHNYSDFKALLIQEILWPMLK